MKRPKKHQRKPRREPPVGYVHVAENAYWKPRDYAANGIPIVRVQRAYAASVERYVPQWGYELFECRTAFAIQWRAELIARVRRLSDIAALEEVREAIAIAAIQHPQSMRTFTADEISRVTALRRNRILKTYGDGSAVVTDPPYGAKKPPKQWTFSVDLASDTDCGFFEFVEMLRER